MRQRRWIGWTLGLVFLIAVLWVGYWFAARYAAESALARFASGGGSGIECTGQTLGGFPLKLDVRCDRVTFTSTSGTITAGIGGAAATAPLFAPGRIDATIDAPLVANAPANGVALTASWSLASLSASAWLDGLTGFAAAFTSLEAETDGNLAGVPMAALTAATASGTIAPAGSGDYTATADASRVVVTTADGRTLPELDGEARVTLAAVGGSLGNDPIATVLDWLRRGGSARIERLKVAGAGAIVTADGTLSLSSDGMIDGNLLVRWNDVGALARLLDTLVPGTRAKLEEPVPGIGMTPLDGLTMMSADVETIDGPLRQTAVTIRRGFVMLGVLPLPIDPIPPLRF